MSEKEDPRIAEYKKSREFALRCKYGYVLAKKILALEAQEAEAEKEEAEELRERISNLEHQNLLIHEALTRPRNQDDDDIPSLYECEQTIEDLMSREPTTPNDIKEALAEELYRLKLVYSEIKKYAKRIIDLETELAKFKKLKKLAED